MAKTGVAIPEVSISGYVVCINLDNFSDITDDDGFFHKLFDFALSYNTDEITVQLFTDNINDIQVSLSVDSGVGAEKARRHVETILRDFFQQA